MEASLIPLVLAMIGTPNEYSLMMLLIAEEHEIMHMSSKLMRVQSN